MNSNSILYINFRDDFFRINISSIVYFEAEGNYTNFVLKNGTKSTVCMNLLQVQDLLSKSLKEAAKIFARVGRKHIVNLNYVFQIAILRQRLILSDGDRFAYSLAISKDALKKLREIFVSSKAAVAERGDNA